MVEFYPDIDQDDMAPLQSGIAHPVMGHGAIGRKGDDRIKGQAISPIFEPKDLVTAAAQITFDKLLQFHQVWLKNIFLTWFLTGNLTKENAFQLTTSIENTLFVNRIPLPKVINICRIYLLFL